MNIIKLYEEFKKSTLNVNNREYNSYYKRHKNDYRDEIVAWSSPGSQEKNFSLVEKNINSGESLMDYGCGIGDLLKYLEDHNKQLSNYIGLDINNKFIRLAKKSYPDNNFKKINSVEDVTGEWDNVCSIGVFTWFIEKEDFINIIHKLYEVCNKQVLITCLYNTNVNYKDDNYWKKQYRSYNEELFENLFPEYDFEYDFIGNTMLVKIKK